MDGARTSYEVTMMCCIHSKHMCTSAVTLRIHLQETGVKDWTFWHHTKACDQTSTFVLSALFALMGATLSDVMLRVAKEEESRFSTAQPTPKVPHGFWRQPSLF